MQVTDDNGRCTYTDGIDENGCQMNASRPEIDKDKCTACGDCVTACSGGAVTLLPEQNLVINDALCTYCGECEDVCPTEAISLPV